MTKTALNTTGNEFCSGILKSDEVDTLLKNPRAKFIEAVKKKDVAACIIKTAEIHGHYCPGSALGVMASLYGLELLGDDGINSDGIMENLLAIAEINACFTDGIQAISGCTLGNNSLIYRDIGKHAVTFAIRGKKEAVRVALRPNFTEYIKKSEPQFYPLMEKVIMNREGGKEEEKKYRECAKKAAFALAKTEFENLFDAKTVTPDIPGYAPITNTAYCPVCKEYVMATKVSQKGPFKGECRMCSGKYFELNGSGIVGKNISTGGFI